VTAKTLAGHALAIDWTRCDGHGLCAALLTGAVRMDEWGYPVIDQAAADATSTSDLRRAVGACPSLALRLERRR
jgi:ferredoxin